MRLGVRFYITLAIWIAVIGLGLMAARPTHADEPVYSEADARLAIAEAADTYGLSEAWLLSVVRCEARMDPYAVGDSGHSFGLAQLNDRRTGLLGHFHAQGYASAFDPYSAADYLGRAFSGEFADEGIGWWRWSCA